MRSNLFFSAVSFTALAACAPSFEGDWEIFASCPPQSHFGEIEILATANAVEIDQGVFEGTISNNLGERGTFTARLDRDKLETNTAWDGARPTSSLLIYNKDTDTFDGIDSNGCSLRVKRP